MLTIMQVSYLIHYKYIVLKMKNNIYCTVQSKLNLETGSSLQKFNENRICSNLFITNGKIWKLKSATCVHEI